MPEVRFYHLQRQSLEESLPKLIEKVCEAGLKAVVKVPNIEIATGMDRALWDYSPNSFIPHDVGGCKYPELQPVYLTTTDDNPAEATIQVLVNAVDSEDMEAFDRCLYMFDGRDEQIVAKARSTWKSIKDKGWEMSYWQQREMGGWEKKA